MQPLLRKPASHDLNAGDIHPTPRREFRVDSVVGEGFANAGDLMPGTPALIERLHQTARGGFPGFGAIIVKPRETGLECCEMCFSCAV